MRKKLQRQRRKNQGDKKGDDDENGDTETPTNELANGVHEEQKKQENVMGEISNQVLNQQQEDQLKKKKPTKKASADGLDQKINGLLLDGDEEQEQLQ